MILIFSFNGNWGKKKWREVAWTNYLPPLDIQIKIRFSLPYLSNQRSWSTEAVLTNFLSPTVRTNLNSPNPAGL